MGKLSSSARKALPGSEFGLPAERKYPMPDRSHAANAKARASEAEKAGRITPAEDAEIDAKADRVLGVPHGPEHEAARRSFRHGTSARTR